MFPSISDRDRSMVFCPTPDREYDPILSTTIYMQSVALLWFRGCVLECIMGPRDTNKSPPKFTNQKRRIPNKFPNIIATGVGLPIMSHNLHVYKLLDRRHVTISYLFVGHKNRNNTACPETLELWSRLNALETFASDSLFPHLNCTQDWMGLLHVIAVIITRRKYLTMIGHL